MTQYNISSRRRVATKRGYNSPGRAFDIEVPISDSNKKTRIPHRIRRRSLPCASHRLVLTAVTFVSMFFVGVGIMIGTYTLLLPPEPEQQFVTIERSGYKKERDEWGNIVLGKRPSPQWENVYKPAELEAFVVENGFSLGYDRQVARESKISQSRNTEFMSLFATIQRQNIASPIEYGNPVNTVDMPSGCELWVSPEVTNAEVYSGLQSFRAELEAYEFAMLDWTWVPPTPQGDSLLWGWSWNDKSDESKDEAKEKRNIRDFFESSSNKNDICHSLEIHPEGLQGIFNSTLSQLPSDEGDGAFLEPLLPPLRHPEFCFSYYELQNETIGSNGKKRNKKSLHADNHYFLDTAYIVHDFAAMCRKNIHKRSRTAFVDIGKPFGFRNENVRKDPPPSLALIRLYERFGFVFDHIYGYGINPWNPEVALDEIPDDLKAAYHDWNLGVDSDPTSYANPFKIISEAYRPEDFVVVKITTNNEPNLSIPLAHQLLMEEFDRTSKPPFKHKLSDLIDVVYLSHQFTMKELAIPWKDSMRGASMKDAMDFFTSLREHGIAAHYWI